MRDYAEIIPIYEQRWAEQPDSTYFVPLANAYRAVGRSQQAVETLKEGLERHPDYLSARGALAAAYHSAGLTTEAEEEAQRVLAAQPENLLVRRLLVACHRERGRLEEALDETRQLLRLAPDDTRIQATLEELEALLDQDAKEAVAEAPPAEPTPAEAPTEKPTEPEPTETLAELYANQGHLEEAIAVYHSLLEKEPENERFLQRLEALQGELVPSGLALAAPEEALAALVDDEAAVEEIHRLFPYEQPPEPHEEDDPNAHVIATLEGWLDALEQRRGSQPAGR
ncbi:MAG: tetratricopeptide repeat protein [bacterium]|nr:tetratricopeptide repeat protein [bacterium]